MKRAPALCDPLRSRVIGRVRASAATELSRLVLLRMRGQGEAVALSGDGRAFYTVPEGSRPALRRYEPSS